MIGKQWSGYPLQRNDAQRKKEAQRLQKEQEEASQKEENEQEVLQDGNEMASSFESRPLFWVALDRLLL